MVDRSIRYTAAQSEYTVSKYVPKACRRSLPIRPIHLGHNHPIVPAVTSAYTRPSKTDLSVVPHERPCQIESCNSARL